MIARLRPRIRSEPDPPSDGRRSAYPGGLPPVLLASLPRRLGLAALCYATIFFLNVAPFYAKLLWDVARGMTRDDVWMNEWVSPAFIAMGLAIFLLSRSRRLGPVKLQYVGLAFEVIGSLGIAIASISPVFAPIDGHYYFGIPWTCVWIAVYPLMVPSRPGHAAWAGGLATAMAALGLWINVQISPVATEFPAGPVWFFLAFANVLCAGWGVLSSVILNDLGRQVDEARQMGSYKLEELLGKGGMGEVWKARHRLLARPAAVKLIRPENLGTSNAPMVLRRFEHEAQATARLQSPHSISLFDYGTSDDGTFYYVMELLEGLDLDSLVQRFGPVEPARVIHWMRQACQSLEEAHQKGLIHRDIKPANLYACHHGLEFDFLKVLDFGLVKTEAIGERLQSMAATGQLAVGTPAYISPEIARGEKDIDGRADLYALGCVAYWLLTAQLVFQVDTAMKMLLGHIQEQPVRPSQRAEVEIPADLENIVMECLNKAPGDRPGSAAELERRLSQCVDADAWDAARARRWWEAHRPSSAVTPIPTSTQRTAVSPD